MHQVVSLSFRCFVCFCCFEAWSLSISHKVCEPWPLGMSRLATSKVDIDAIFFTCLQSIHYIYVYIHQPVIWVSEKITLLVVGLSRIARGEVVSFCVPAVFWWFFSYSAVVHVSFVLLCAVLCCFRTFICILCALVISLCAAVFWWLFGSSSCIIFAMHRAMTILLHWHWQRIYLSD